MSDAKKPHLIVEDKSSLECRKEGKDTLVRTTDRKATAEEMKKNQSSIKPLHD